VYTVLNYIHPPTPFSHLLPTLTGRENSHALLFSDFVKKKMTFLFV
jgi:hypothetical protein